jgi:hypothetical protein
VRLTTDLCPAFQSSFLLLLSLSRQASSRSSNKKNTKLDYVFAPGSEYAGCMPRARELPRRRGVSQKYVLGVCRLDAESRRQWVLGPLACRMAAEDLGCLDL